MKIKTCTAFFCYLAALLMVMVLVPAPYAMTAREIMEKVDARDDGDNMTADLGRQHKLPHFC